MAHAGNKLLLKKKYTYTHTYVCTYISTYIHTYIRTYIHIHTYIHTYIHTHTHIHTYVHTYTYTHTYMQERAGTCHRIPTRTHTQICVCVYIYIHTHTYTHPSSEPFTDPPTLTQTPPHSHTLTQTLPTHTHTHTDPPHTLTDTQIYATSDTRRDVSSLLTSQPRVVLRLFHLALLLFQTPVLGDQVLYFGRQLLDLRRETDFPLQAISKEARLLVTAALVYTDLQNGVKCFVTPVILSDYNTKNHPMFALYHQLSVLI